MFPEERRRKIVELVVKNKSVLVKDLCELFGVTAETIRRDLIQLEAEGKLKKGHGGAYVDDSVKNDIHINIRESVYMEEKNEVGKACAKLVNDGDVILLDASTTAFHILPHIKDKENLTIITNSIKVANSLSNLKHMDLIVLGGKLDHTTRSLLGRETEDTLESYWVDKAFVSCRGISMKNGITDGNADQGLIRSMMLERANTNILVLDQTKLDITSFYKIDDFSKIDKIAIDGELEDKWKVFFEKKNIEII